MTMLLLLCTGIALAGPTVSSGWDPAAATKGAFRMRNLVNPNGLGGGEAYLGDADLSPRVENDFYRGAICDGTTGNYGSWNASNHVVFKYNKSTGKMTTKFEAAYDYCLEYNIGDMGGLNYLQIDVVARKTGTGVAFKNVKLNGHSLGDFSGSGWSTWQVKGLNFTSSFTIEGDLELSWPTPPPTSGSETNKLQLTVGYVEPPPEFYINDKSNPENFGTPTWSMNHVAGLTASGRYDAYYEYSTSDGSAMSTGDCADYVSKQNFIQKIPAGQTIRHATYTINDDAYYEPDETVIVTVHRAWWDDGSDTPIKLKNSTATGTIKNDDAPPTIAIMDKSQVEDFPDELRFPVKLSEPTAWDVYFTWMTMDGSAIGGDDYTSVASKTTMIKGEKCRVYGHAVVEMIDDVCLEKDENMYVKLTGAYVDDPQQTPLTITGYGAEGTILNDDDPPVAAFISYETYNKNGTVCMLFVNQSTNADEYLWDFGDGTTSTEKSPYHCFYNPPHKWYDITLTAICEDHQDVEMKERHVTVHAAPSVAFNGTPIVGPPELAVQFTNNSGGGVNKFMWDYGDGETEQLSHSVMDMEHPMHTYMAEGEYTVGLFASGNGGSNMMVIPNMIYVDSTSVELALEGGSDTVPGEEWDNAIDHDVVSSNACATGMNTGDAHVVFSFADGMEKMLHKVRIAPKAICPYQMSDPGAITIDSSPSVLVELTKKQPRLVGSKTNLAKDFQILVSPDSMNWELAFEGELTTKCDFEIFEFDAVAARYIKLVLLNARGENSPFVKICEFQAFATPMPAPVIEMAEAGSDRVSVANLPMEYGLSANYPNPFNPETTISYQLPEAADVALHIYNIQGQRVATLENSHRDAGTYHVVWHAGENAGGMYFFKIIATNADSEVYTLTRKMTLLK